MNKWNILGIDETDNPEEIKEAYMTKLTYCNPEDDPNGFIELRLAYEEALKSLKEDNEEDFDSTPLGQFFIRVDAVYHDFKKRINLELWKELLSDEICMRLDNMDETEMTFLSYLMGHHLLPSQVWRLLDSHFNWQAREKLLKDIFPPNFINYVLQEISSDTLLYSHLQCSVNGTEATTEQIDQWINLFYDLKNINKNDETELEKFINLQQKMEVLPVKHVYYDLEVAKFHLHNQEYDKSLEVIEPIYKEFPEDKDIWYGYAMAVMYVDESRIPEALELFEGLNKAYPQSWLAKRGLLDAYYFLGEYDKSHELVNEILKVTPSDYHANLRKNNINERFIEIFEGIREVDPTNFSVTVALSTHYLNAEKYDKCLELLLSMDSPPQTEENIKYYDNLTHAYLHLSDFEKVIDTSKICINIKPNSNMYYLYATAVMNINPNEIESVISILDEGIALEDDDINCKLRIYVLKSLQLFAALKMDEALETVNKGLELSQDPYLYAIKADILRFQGHLSEAVECYEKSQEFDPYSYITYLRQIDLYSNMEMYDEVLRVGNMALNVGISHIEINRYMVAAYRETEEHEKAQKLLAQLFEREDKNECLDSLHEEAALLASAEEDYNTALVHIREALKIASNTNRNITLCNILTNLEHFDEAMQVINSILENEPTNTKALMERAIVLRMQAPEPPDEALEIYKQVIEIDDTIPEAYYHLMDIYEQRNDSESIVLWLERSLDSIDSLYHRLSVGFYSRRYRSKEATDNFYKETIKMYPEYAAPNTHYGYFLANMDKDAEAIEQFKQSLAKDDSNYSLYDTLAYYLSIEKRYDEALEVLDKGEAQQGDNLGAITMRRADVLDDMLRYSEALQNMLKALTMEDSLDDEWTIQEIHNRIGDLYMHNYNDATSALRHYQIALELDEDDDETNLNLGHYMQYYANDYEKAIEYYNKSIESKPDKYSVCHTYMARGRAYKHLGQQNNAEQDFLKGLEIFQTKKEKEFSPCWDIYIALAYLELEQYDKAQTILEDMIDTPSHPKSWCIKPKCNECIHGLARIEVAKNNLQKAIEYYEDAISITNSVRYNRELALLKSRL